MKNNRDDLTKTIREILDHYNKNHDTESWIRLDNALYLCMEMDIDIPILVEVRSVLFNEEER